MSEDTDSNVEEVNPSIEVTETVSNDSLAGVPEGTVEKIEHPNPELRARIDHEEKVVYEYNEDDQVVGWHKASADESKGNE